MARWRYCFPPIAIVFAVAAPAMAQRIIPAATESASIPVPPYPEVAELVDEAPLVIDATVRSAARLHGADAAGAPAGTARLLMTVDVRSLIRGDSPLPARVSYLWLAPLDARGRVPALRKTRVLLFARAVATAGNQVQLVRRDGQRPWSAGLDTLVRAVVKEEVAKDAPPSITGVGHAFHAPGTLPGEGTTQVFLQTADHRPISLTIERSAIGDRHWSLALGDIVGAGAPPPAHNTLLWFRHACVLPGTLPASATSDIGADDATAAAADYGYVIEQLGPCSTGKPPE
jgi:hypothetical protein